MAVLPVVTTRVHQARMATGVWQPGGLLNRQRVHIGTQTQLARTCAALELPHDTGATQATRHRIAPALQALCDQITGALACIANSVADMGLLRFQLEVLSR